MKGIITFSHQFVEFVPEHLEQGVIYVSIPYATVTHKCACGCALGVVTPLAPYAWQLTFDGESVSLYPSIGNWTFPCRSHYWIRNNKVKWSYEWSEKEINAGRRAEHEKRERHFARGDSNSGGPVEDQPTPKTSKGLFKNLKKRRHSR
ncbi:MAG TPA: DUF6527 family protein [Patescibacteria group bacterium]